jgi:hypothetical protein
VRRTRADIHQHSVRRGPHSVRATRNGTSHPWRPHRVRRRVRRN